MINDIFPIIKTSKRWDEQAKLLSSIQLTEQNIRQLNTSKNCEILRTMLENPRSKLITTVCEFLIEIFQNYGPLVHNLALNMLGNDTIFKLLNSSNKVIANSMHELIKTIVVNCPHSKFYTIFASEFNNCKNHTMREYITSYLLVLVESIKYPNNFLGLVKLWESDSNSNVRKNIILLRQIIQSNSQNLYHAQTPITKKSQPKIKKQPLQQQSMNIKQVSEEEEEPKMEESLFEREEKSCNFITDSFMCGETYRSIEEDIQFLLSKIKSNVHVESWNAKFMALQELCKFVVEGSISGEQYQAVFETLVVYLDERKSKVYQIVFEAIRTLIEQNKSEFMKYLETGSVIFVKKSLINENIAKQLIGQLIKIDSIKYLVTTTQLSLDIKSIKSKVLLLDILANSFCRETFDDSKVSVIVKILCELITKAQNNKEIYIPCMVVISHFRVIYPMELLASLLAQGNQTLKRIINIAEQIDPQLREKILEFIHDMKGCADQHIPHYKEKITKKKLVTTRKVEGFRNKNNCIYNDSSIQQQQQQEETYSQISYQIQASNKISCYLEEIRQQEKENAVQNMAKYIFSQYSSLTTTNFRDIIKLTEFLTCENLLIDLELLLEEMCKVESLEYLNALFMVIEQCDLNSIEKEYINSYLQKIMVMTTEFHDLISEQHADRILRVYRASKCPKLRMTCIKLLVIVPQQIYEDMVTEKEKQLIGTYRAKNKQNRRSSIRSQY